MRFARFQRAVSAPTSKPSFPLNDLKKKTKNPHFLLYLKTLPNLTSQPDLFPSRTNQDQHALGSDSDSPPTWQAPSSVFAPPFPFRILSSTAPSVKFSRGPSPQPVPFQCLVTSLVCLTWRGSLGRSFVEKEFWKRLRSLYPLYTINAH